MSRSLVLGLGNRHSGADAFGPAVLDRLREMSVPPGVELLDANTDLLAHIGRFQDCDTVVLIDAVIDDTGPDVAVVPEATFSAWNDRSLSAHELSAVGCVKLFRALQRRAADGSRPSIVLVALLIPEEQFRRAPTPGEVDAGTAAAYLASCGTAGV